MMKNALLTKVLLLLFGVLSSVVNAGDENAHMQQLGSDLRKELQDEFVRKMDAAVGRQKRNKELVSRLLEVAKPVPQVDAEETPEFLQPLNRGLEEYQNYAVNLTEYALKYIGCSNIHTYSDEMAEDEDATSVLGMSRFVVARLCPLDECSSYHKYGCNSGFGDYLIPMEDYLELMTEDYFAQYEEYCTTCYQCAKANAQAQDDDAAYGDDAAGDDAANGDDASNGDDAAGDDAANGDDANRRKLGNDDYYAGADWYNQYNQNNQYNDDDEQNNVDANEDNCANYEEACESFATACKDYTQKASYMEEYFQCHAYNIGNGDLYLGPHCRSDGKTIGIGLYYDEDCNEYNADLTDISTYTGLDLSDEYLKPYYTESCISCLASDGYELEQGNNMVNPICGSLYDYSAKCNKYMGTDDIYSENQEDTEDRVCSFIENLIKNQYDEYGEIYLEGDGWQSYIPDVREMTQFQNVIRKSKYTWYPRRGGYASDPGSGAHPLGRMHSGIIQGRSRSEFEMAGGTYA